VLLAIAACKSSPPKAPVIGEAYVGPATLNVRSDFPLQSTAVATVRHGDRLEIIGTHRRFVRVRAPNGAEGWTDERQLLSAADMANLKELARRAAKLPAQGVASTYGDLNVHTLPARQSPSFLQIKEKDKMDVLLHVVTPRADAPRKPLIPPAPKKKAKAPEKKQAKQEKYPAPPMPKPPGPPSDWLDLSHTEPDESEPEEEPEPKPPAPTDDWSLIRTPTGQTGWVLTRRLVMAIPDEVAQYAEGHRIVSYFSLGEVHDAEVTKNIWLWTTTTNSAAPWDFDSFRVFVWSLRHHRYETAHIERNIHGYAPVLLKEVQYSLNSKQQPAKYPGFSVCLEGRDGQRVRREFALLQNIIRFAGQSPCEAPAEPLPIQAAAPLAAGGTGPAAPAKESLGERLKKRWKALFEK